MKYQNKKISSLLLATLIIFTSGCSAVSNNQPTAISASGVVEAKQVIVSSEIGGDVLDVLVKEGDMVKKGQELVRFNDEALIMWIM